MAVQGKAIQWFAPEVGTGERDRVVEVIASGYINDGDVTRVLEQRVAKAIGAKHCVAVTSGTAAISLALMAKGIGPGDEVIVPDLTFVATANAARMTGAEVKLVDAEPKRFTLDVDKAVAAIGPKTRAIVTVDVNGRGCDYGRLEPLCKARGLALICDSAEALGSRYGNRALGTFGDAGCFSFSAAKTVSSGQGGMVATDDDAIHDRLRELKDQGRRTPGTGGNDLHPVMGFNFKYTNIQAAVALAQMERLDDRLAHFRKRDGWYRELLAGCPGIDLPPLEDGDEIRQWTDVLVDNRDALAAHLASLKIGNRPFWYPLHTQEPYKGRDEDFPGAMAVSYRGLWLPSAFDLTREDVEYVAAIIRDFMTGKKRRQA
jgi:perosamine synthetase